MNVQIEKKFHCLFTMIQSIQHVSLQFCATSLLGIVSCSGDRLVDNSKNNVLRASFDNLTHALIGGLSWILVLILSKKTILPNIYSVVYCTAISSLIDLDHFVAAASFNLRVSPFFSYFSYNTFRAGNLLVKYTRITLTRAISLILVAITIE